MKEAYVVPTEIERSRLVQAFKETGMFAILQAKLESDYRDSVNTLIKANDEGVRGKAQYIESLLGWFNLESEREEVLRWQKKVLRNLNDDPEPKDGETADDF